MSESKSPPTGHLPERLLALAFAVAAVSLNSLSRFPEWDEANYYSQVFAPGTQPLAVHRARGITLPLWPLRDMPFGALHRFVLVCMIASLLYVAAVQWRRQLGTAAIWGLGVFSAQWLTLFYAPSLSPNIWVAFLSLILVGSAANYLTSTMRTDLLVGAGAAALIMLFRPADGVLVAGSLTVCLGLVAVARRRHGGRWKPAASLALVLAVGCAAGLSQWVYEAFTRFGGPLARARTASRLLESASVTRSHPFIEQLRLSDGPLIGPDPVLDINWIVIMTMVLTIAMAVVGLALMNRPVRHRLLIVLLAPIGVLLAFYLTVVDALAPRFLLPAFALLHVPLGVALSHAIRLAQRGTGVLRLAGAATVVAVTAAVAWQVDTHQAMDRREFEQQAVAAELAGVVSQVADGRPCRVESQYGWPQIALNARCAGRRLQIEASADAAERLEARAVEAGETVIMLRIGTFDQPARPGWTERSVAPGGRPWSVRWYEP